MYHAVKTIVVIEALVIGHVFVLFLFIYPICDCRNQNLK